MAYYAALSHILDDKKNQELRPLHLEYLEKLEKEEKVFARGPFGDGSGGLVIYVADSYEEALALAEEDPYISNKVRGFELKEWKKN